MGGGVALVDAGALAVLGAPMMDTVYASTGKPPLLQLYSQAVERIMMSSLSVRGRDGEKKG